MNENLGIALIPARSGSVRVPHKNIRIVGQHPLIAHSIHAAVSSNCFERTIVVTDSAKYAKIAREYGAEVPELRPPETATSQASDITWITWILNLIDWREEHNWFSILRPTSPFRDAETIRAAVTMFMSNKCDSLRAFSRASEHPGKMWTKFNGYATPLLGLRSGDAPWHSSQTAMLPEIFVQNASLEIAWASTVLKLKSIAGNSVCFFESEGATGFDINTLEDLEYLEFLLQTGREKLSDPAKLNY